MTTISIFGCGWLGLDLAKTFLKDKDYIIKGSTTTFEKLDILEKNKIIPYILDTSKNSSLDDFLVCDILIISIPPKNNDTYLEFLSSLSRHKLMYDIKQIIFISSTSVYPCENKEYKENERISYKNSSKPIIYEAEQIFNDINYKVVILRCAGLMGYDRVAGKYFANKPISTGNERVNYIHKDDVINIIQLIISKKIKTGIYNLCSPKHPTKKEVYLNNAKKYGFAEPIFTENRAKTNRIINTDKVVKKLEYKYIFVNPLKY